MPTPNIDRLAHEGVRYTNAFCTAGVCAPSRNAIITGRYQTSNGGHNMRTLGNTYPEKTGLPKTYSIVPPPDVRAFPEYLRSFGYYTLNNVKTDYQFEESPTVWDLISNKAHWRGRPADRPFFAVFNNTATHESQVWARSTLPLRVDPKRIQVPPYYPDTKTVRHDIARFYSNIRDLDDWVGELLQQLEEDQLLDKTIIFFWSDHGDGLPFVKREVYDRGIRVPLIIRYPDGQQAGTTHSGLISMIDLAPTVLSLAGRSAPTAMQGKAFAGKFATTEPRSYVYAARDRIDSELDRVRSTHDGRYQYIRNFFPEKPLYMDIEFRKQQPMMTELLQLRDAGKLNPVQMNWFRPTKPVEELYDLQADPHQLNNLVDQPERAAELLRLRNAMDTWLKESGDLGSIPEKELIAQWWNCQDVPPVTQAPVIRRRGKQIVIECTTPGASIGYKIVGKHQSWQVYTESFKLKHSEQVKAVAMRIGYTKSSEVKFPN